MIQITPQIIFFDQISCKIASIFFLFIGCKSDNDKATDEWVAAMNKVGSKLKNLVKITFLGRLFSNFKQISINWGAPRLGILQTDCACPFQYKNTDNFFGLFDYLNLIFFRV